MQLCWYQNDFDIEKWLTCSVIVYLHWDKSFIVHLAVSGLTVRLPVWPWQQVCVKRVRKWGVQATWIFIMPSPVYWRQRGGHTQVRLFGPPESTVNWPGRRREEGGSELIAHIRVIQVLPVADNWIDEDVIVLLKPESYGFELHYVMIGSNKSVLLCLLLEKDVAQWLGCGALPMSLHVMFLPSQYW